MRRTVITNIYSVEYIDRKPDGTYYIGTNLDIKYDKYNDPQKYLDGKKYIEMPESFEYGMTTITTNNGLVLIYDNTKSSGILYDLFPISHIDFSVDKYNELTYFQSENYKNFIYMFSQGNYGTGTGIQLTKNSLRIYFGKNNSDSEYYVKQIKKENEGSQALTNVDEWYVVQISTSHSKYDEYLKYVNTNILKIGSIIKFSNVNPYSFILSLYNECRPEDLILKNSISNTSNFIQKNKQSYHSVVCKSKYDSETETNYLKPQCNIITSDHHGTIDMDLPSKDYQCNPEDIYCQHGLYKFTKSELDSFYIKAKPYLYISTGEPEMEETSNLSFIKCSNNIYYIANITDESYVEFKVKGSSNCIVEFM